jgi:hypothetical protein
LRSQKDRGDTVDNERMQGPIFTRRVELKRWILEVRDG